MTVEQTIQAQIDSAPVVLYMKGNADFPMCGFSGRVVQVLKEYGIAFTAINVMEDESIRQGIKTFSNWPTIPQLYVKGEFVGGCDIINEMHASGELKSVLEGSAPA